MMRPHDDEMMVWWCDYMRLLFAIKIIDFPIFDESVTHGPTDGRTDGPTDRPDYRDARTHLKMIGQPMPTHTDKLFTSHNETETFSYQLTFFWHCFPSAIKNGFLCINNWVQGKWLYCKSNFDLLWKATWLYFKVQPVHIMNMIDNSCNI